MSLFGRQTAPFVCGADYCTVRPCGWPPLADEPQRFRDGWLRVGWLSVAHYEKSCDHHERKHRRRRCDCLSSSSQERRKHWQPRDDYLPHCHHNDDNDGDYYAQPNSACAQVICHTRRYRLYARPASYYCSGADRVQYAVTDETVPERDAILIFLYDDPRVDDDCCGGRRRGYGRYRFQPLHSGDLVRVPSEHSPFRVHLYCDDDNGLYY